MYEGLNSHAFGLRVNSALSRPRNKPAKTAEQTPPQGEKSFLTAQARVRSTGACFFRADFMLFKELRKTACSSNFEFIKYNIALFIRDGEVNK